MINIPLSYTITNKDLQIISSGIARVFIYNLPIDGGCAKNIPVLLLSGVEKNLLGKELFATLLAAKTSGKQLIIQTEGCSSDYAKQRGRYPLFPKSATLPTCLD